MFVYSVASIDVQAGSFETVAVYPFQNSSKKSLARGRIACKFIISKYHRELGWHCFVLHHYCIVHMCIAMVNYLHKLDGESQLLFFMRTES